MKLIGINFSFFLFVFLCSCSTKEKKEVRLLKEKATLISMLDYTNEGISQDAYYFQNSENGELHVLNYLDSSIYLFDLDKIEFVKKVQLPFSIILGACYNVKRNTFFVLANDSLFEFNKQNQKLLGIPFSKTSKGFPTVVNTSAFNLLSKNDNVYCHYFYDDQNTFKSSAFFKQPIELVYNLSNKKVKLLQGKYPDSYTKVCYGLQFSPDRIENKKNEHLYCFAYNDSLFLNSNGKITAKFFGTRRSYVTSAISFKDIHKQNSSLFQEFLDKTSYYYVPKYFPFSDKYIRKFSFKTNKSSKTKVCVIVYDKNLDYIGETEFYDFGGGQFFDSKKYGIIKLIGSNGKFGVYKIKWE